LETRASAEKFPREAKEKRPKNSKKHRKITSLFQRGPTKKIAKSTKK